MNVEDLKESIIEQIKQVQNQDTLLKVLDVLQQTHKAPSTFEGLPDFEEEGEISLSDFRSKIRDRE